MPKSSTLAIFIAAGLCFTATVYNEVDIRNKVKAMKKNPVVTRDDIHKLDKCYDRRKVILAATLTTVVANGVDMIKDFKK